MTPDALLAALQLGDGALPSGGFAFSWGLEGFFGHDPGEASAFSRPENHGFPKENATNIKSPAPFRALCAAIEIVRPDGTRLAADRFDIDGRRPSAGRLAKNFGCHGTLVVVRRLTDDARAALAGAIGEAVAPIDGVYAATSALPSDAGLGFRVAAVSGAALRAATAAAWAAARTILTGVAPARRRM